MIAATELRIGNLFWDNYGGYYIVRGLRTKKDGNPWDIEAQHVRGGLIGAFTFEQAIPVALTPEILEKCGFVKDTDIWHGDGISYYHLPIAGMEDVTDNIDIRFGSEEDDTGAIDAVFVGQQDIKHIRSLHHLQNLIYVLTGKELIYTT